jgi:hypothetical protein
MATTAIAAYVQPGKGGGSASIALVVGALDC